MTDNCKQAECIDIPKVKNADCPNEPEITPVIFGNAELLGGDTSPIELTPEQIKLLCEGVEPCGEITPDKIRAFNTAIYWLGQQINSLCQKIKNIACQFVLTTIADGEEVEGYLAKIKTSDGGCRTGIVKPSSGFNFVNDGNPVLLWSSGGGEDVLTTDLPWTSGAVDISSHIPTGVTPTALIIRTYLEIDREDAAGSPANLGAIVNLQINSVAQVMTTETGGSTGGEDNSLLADLHIPYSPTVTATMTTPVGRDNLRCETFAKLVGWI